MAAIEYQLQLYDGMSQTLQSIRTSLNMVARSIQVVQTASVNMINITVLQATRNELVVIDNNYNEINQSISQVRSNQENLNDETKAGSDEAKKLKGVWEKISGIWKDNPIVSGIKEAAKNASEFQAAGNVVQNQTGMQGQDLDMAKAGVKNLYSDNMGKSMDDVAESMSSVYQATGLTGDSLEQTTRAGLLLRDIFGLDITDSAKTAAMMQQQFGLSGAEAYDLIVQGAQHGLNSNGDLLSSITEYSSQFSKIGMGSADMFNMLINGTKSGKFGVSELGTAIKGFADNAVSGSAGALEGFQALGLDAQAMAGKFGAGGESAKQAFQETIAALGGMDDPVQRNLAGAGLFGEAWQKLGYSGVMALGNVNGSAQLTAENLESLNQVQYSGAGSALASLGRTIDTSLGGIIGPSVERAGGYINDFTNGLQGNISEVQSVFGYLGIAIGAIGTFFTDNWSIIEPILWGIVAALVVYNATMGIAWLTTLLAVAAKVGHAIASAAETVAIYALILAQEGLNAALALCPLTWIIILIIALIAIFYSVVAAVNHFMGTSISATGLIAGAFAVLGAHIINRFVIPAWNMIAEFINFFYNVWNDPIAAVKILFLGLASDVIGYILNMARAIETVINKIPGVEVDITSGLDSFQKNIDSMSQKIKSESEWKEIVAKKEYIDYEAAGMAGYNLGKGMEDKGKDAFDAMKAAMSGTGTDPEAALRKALEEAQGPESGTVTDPGLGAQSTWEGIGNNTGATAGNTAMMADSMDIMDQELKYMRDAAEQEVINRFTLADLKIETTNNNTLTTKTDFDDLARKMGESTAEVVAMSAEGVYA